MTAVRAVLSEWARQDPAWPEKLVLAGIYSIAWLSGLWAAFGLLVGN